MTSRRLAAVARAVTEGHPVDWDSLTRQSHPGERAQLAHLRMLSGLAPAAGADAARRQASAGQLPHPLLWRGIVFISAVQGLLGIAAFAWRFAGTLPPFPVALQGSSVAALIVCAFALIRFGHDARALNLAALLLLLGSSGSQPFLGPYQDNILGIFVYGIYPDAWLPYAAWAFVRDFPRILRFSRTDTLCSLGVSVSLLAGLVLFVGNVLVIHAGAADVIPELSLLRRRSTTFYWPVVAGLLLPALGVMLARIRHSGRAERRRVAFFLSGLGAGILPVVTIVLLDSTSPSFNALTSRPEGFAAASAIIYASILSIPFTTTYAVLVERVLAVRVVVRKTLRYALARGTLLGLTTLPLAGLVLWMFAHRDVTIGALFTGVQATVALTLAGLGLLLLMVRVPLLRFLDRRYFREAVDLTAELTRLTDALGEARDVRRVAEIVEATLQHALQADLVNVYRRTGTAFVPVRGRGMPLPAGTALASLMQASADAMDLGPSGIGHLLPREERAWLHDSGVAAIAPMVREEVVVGFIAVGERRNDLEFSAEVLAFLTTAASSATLALGRRVGASAPRLATVRDPEATSVPAAECESCGTVFAASASSCSCGGRLSAAALPHVFGGKFKVLSRLGAGGMGVVYRAVDLSLGRPVALKTLPRLTPDAIERLTSEAQSMARAAHHALATIHAIDTWDRAPVLVIELLEGGTLAERLRQGPLPPREAVLIAIELGASLAHLHRQGLLHRDVKPGNIGFTGSGQMKLLDFGLAAALQQTPLAADHADASDEWPPRTVAGTPMYLPPEAWTGAAPSPAFDLWGAALVLHEMLTGRHPGQTAGSFRQLLAATNLGTLVQRDGFDADVPPAVVEFLAGALSPDPGMRPPSAEAFVRGLAAAYPEDQAVRAHVELLRAARFDV